MIRLIATDMDGTLLDSQKRLPEGFLDAIQALYERGGHNSVNHIDFMFGTSDMTVVGITHDGEEITVYGEVVGTGCVLRLSGLEISVTADQGPRTGGQSLLQLP